MADERTIHEKLVDMLINLHGKEAQFVHWIMQKKPDVTLAMYELFADANGDVTVDYDEVKQILIDNIKSGSSKIALIQMHRQMTGVGLKEAKVYVEDLLAELDIELSVRHSAQVEITPKEKYEETTL